MKRIAKLLAITLALATLSGCYYRMTDRETGAVYYVQETDIELSFIPGNKVFSDADGVMRKLVNPKMETISKAEYLAGREQP